MLARPALQRFSQKRCCVPVLAGWPRAGMLLPPVPGPSPICNFALSEHVTAITENGFLHDWDLTTSWPLRTRSKPLRTRQHKHGRRAVLCAFDLIDFRSGRVAHWLKIKNPAAPAATREGEEDWGR